MFTLEEREEIPLSELKAEILENETYKKLLQKIQEKRLSFQAILNKLDTKDLIPGNKEDTQKKTDIGFPESSQILEKFSADIFLNDRYEESKLYNGKEKTILEYPLNTQYSLKIERSIMNDGSRDAIQFHLLDPNENQTHRVIHFVKKDNEWNLSHREIPNNLQGQGIASKILEISEQCISKISQKEGVKPILKAEVGQIDVLFWFLKNGYSPEKKEDIQKTNRVLSGDKNIKLIGQETTQNYIWGKNEELPWGKYNEEKYKPRYMTDGIRINLIKK